MALKTLVKISGVNNLSDARYAAGMGVEFLGFSLDKLSDYYVKPEDFKAITGWISGVKLVGELSGSDPSLNSILAQYKLDYLQLNASDIGSLAEISIPVIIKIDQTDRNFMQDIFEQHRRLAAYFLIEPNEPIPAEDFLFCLQKATDHPIILGSNINSQNLDQILSSEIKGIALKGGTELRPGYKDFDQLAEILEALEMDD